MSLWNLLKSGGWVMIPLLVCSLVVWCVCVERLWALRRWREKNKEFLLNFSNLWLKGEWEEAKKLCANTDVELAVLGTELLGAKKTNTQNDEKLIARLDRRRIELTSEMKRFLWLLGTIGSVSPFIGLLGTVLGIIHSFQSMAQTGSGGFLVVSAGISEALVATAAGIVVAVIAVFFYNYFQTKVGQLQFQLKLLSEELLELWAESPLPPSLPSKA